MKAIAIVALAIGSILLGLSVFIGVNFKKWSGWLIGLLGFLCGFIPGYMRAGVILGLQVGAIFAFAIIFSGLMVGAQKRYYREVAEGWSTKHEKDIRYPFLVRIVKRLLHRN